MQRRGPNALLPLLVDSFEPRHYNIKSIVAATGMGKQYKRLNNRDEDPVLAKNRIRGSVLQTKGDF